MAKQLFYDKKSFAEITDEEAERIKNTKGTHIDFNGNWLKTNQIEFFEAGRNVESVLWQKTTEELKEIIGEFENQIKEHIENIPTTIKGKFKARAEGKLPDCGMWWLMDRGLALWYLQNNWLTTSKKENEKRIWSLTEKYVQEGIPNKENALEELNNRRKFAEEVAIMEGEPIIRDLYVKEKAEKIAEFKKQKGRIGLRKL